jgi:hypothetical protein
MSNDDRAQKVQKLAADIRRTATVIGIMNDALEEAKKFRPRPVKIIIRVNNPRAHRLISQIAQLISMQRLAN